MPTSQVKEISFRDIIITFQGYLKNGLRAWPFLLLGGVVGGGWMAWSAAQDPMAYEASLSFIVNQEKSSGGLNSVLGRIGFGGGQSENNVNRILKFSTSRLLVHQYLLDSITLHEQRDLLGNHVIAEFGLEEEMNLVEAYGTARLSANTIDSLSIPERSMLKRIYGFLIAGDRKPITNRNDEINDILSLIVRTPDEDLSLLLVEGLYTYLQEYYTRGRIGQAQLTVERLEEKADSILGVLKSAEYQLAAFSDTQLGLISKRDLVQLNDLNRRVQLLSVAYAEIVRNLEGAKFSVSANTPYFQPVDIPFKPLRRVASNPRREGMLGFLLGVIVAFLAASAVHFYREVMAADNPDT